MEPVSAALLMALATGGAGAAGAHAWQSLVALVRRGREHTAPEANTPVGELEPVAAEAELVVFQQEPGDERRARDLAVALAARAGRDAGFAAALNAWHGQAQQSMPGTGAGDVSSSISGGNQGTVATTRDVTGGIHFGAPLPPGTPSGQPGTPPAER